MPFLPTLLHKVLAWKYHRTLATEHGKIKESNDVAEITELLDIACPTAVECIPEAQLALHRSWLPDWFIHNAEQGVREYVDSKPQTRARWNIIFGEEARP
jgi:hypothetical protein